LALGEFAIVSLLVAGGAKSYQISQVVISVVHINMVYMRFTLIFAALILASRL